MWEIPDAPWIRNCERTGYPDNRYLEYCDDDIEEEFEDEEEEYIDGDEEI